MRRLGSQHNNVTIVFNVARVQEELHQADEAQRKYKLIVEQCPGYLDGSAARVARAACARGG